MPNKKLTGKIKKNLFDLEYTKYLQYYNTSIILLFTYIVGIFIAFITKQIDYRNPKQLLFIAPISTAFIVVITILMLNFREKLTKITKEVKKLKL